MIVLKSTIKDYVVVSYSTFDMFLREHPASYDVPEGGAEGGPRGARGGPRGEKVNRDPKKCSLSCTRVPAKFPESDLRVKPFILLVMYSPHNSYRNHCLWIFIGSWIVWGKHDKGRYTYIHCPLRHSEFKSDPVVRGPVRDRIVHSFQH